MLERFNSEILNQRISRRILLNNAATGALVLAVGSSLELLTSACKNSNDSPESRLISVGKKASGQEHVDDKLKGDIVVLQNLSFEQSTQTPYLVNEVYGRINSLTFQEDGPDFYVLDSLDSVERASFVQFFEESKAVQDLPVDFGKHVYTIFLDPKAGWQDTLPVNLTRGVPTFYKRPPFKEYFEYVKYWTSIPDIISISGPSNTVIISTSSVPDDEAHADMPKFGHSGTMTIEIIVDVTHPKNRKRLEEIATPH